MEEHLSERGLEILSCLVAAWQENPLTYGDMSYGEVIDWLDKLGADKPTKLIAMLEEADRYAKEMRNGH